MAAAVGAGFRLASGKEQRAQSLLVSGGSAPHSLHRTVATGAAMPNGIVAARACDASVGGADPAAVAAGGGTGGGVTVGVGATRAGPATGAGVVAMRHVAPARWSP